jgi:hypothetical protein
MSLHENGLLRLSMLVLADDLHPMASSRELPPRQLETPETAWINWTRSASSTGSTPQLETPEDWIDTTAGNPGNRLDHVPSYVPSLILQ